MTIEMNRIGLSELDVAPIQSHAISLSAGTISVSDNTIGNFGTQSGWGIFINGVDNTVITSNDFIGTNRLPFVHVSSGTGQQLSDNTYVSDVATVVSTSSAGTVGISINPASMQFPPNGTPFGIPNRGNGNIAPPSIELETFNGATVIADVTSIPGGTVHAYAGTETMVSRYLGERVLPDSGRMQFSWPLNGNDPIVLIRYSVNATYRQIMVPAAIGQDETFTLTVGNDSRTYTISTVGEFMLNTLNSLSAMGYAPNEYASGEFVVATALPVSISGDVNGAVTIVDRGLVTSRFASN